jgi:hypothetical protein
MMFNVEFTDDLFLINTTNHFIDDGELDSIAFNFIFHNKKAQAIVDSEDIELDSGPSERLADNKFYREFDDLMDEEFWVTLKVLYKYHVNDYNKRKQKTL